MVRSRNSCSKTKRSFSSITLLVFHGMRLFYTQIAKVPAVSGMLPVYSVRDVPGPYHNNAPPYPLFFVSVASKGLKYCTSSLFATHARGLISVAAKGLILHQNCAHFAQGGWA